jgi:LytS/YehU family sensor histidine kinase
MLVGDEEASQRMMADVMFSLMTCATGLIATHGLRAVILSQRWLTQPVRALVIRALIAWVIVSAFLSGLGVLAFATPSPGEPAYATLLPCLMMNVMLIGAWLALYLLAHVYEALQLGNLDRERLRAVNAESQMQALQAQLQPHFLFNSLNTIRALIPASAERARSGVTVLADLLRACLTEGHAETVSLARELELTRLYISMEKLRFGDELRLVEALDAETLSMQIPPLLLLTLAENAVKHGLLHEPEQSVLKIHSQLKTDHWCLSMTSPGRLIEPAGILPQVESLGLGLANSQERLRLIFGPQASLKLSEIGGLVLAEVRIPIQPT